ncbi:anthranilate synthase family protein [Streptomyces sp. NPDC017546]|uniref:anthranilate synthase family protein n=1 Tax=unclassified Streptomyces TaxID=2593676 RepID=UPI00235FD090|nr:anthranilate synthase family protein [Streptomyces sp. MMBL 11-1]
MTADLLDAVLDDTVGDYALICRSDERGRHVQVIAGETGRPASLAAIDFPRRPAAGTASSDMLVVVPYRQLAERGHPAVDDGAPLLAMRVTAQERHPVPSVLGRLPDRRVSLENGHFDADDREYAQCVASVLADEIGTGQGANFVIKRTYLADVVDPGPDAALSAFRHLLAAERGAYWTFLVRTAGSTIVGASPERHVGLIDDVVRMNPISGTYRYPAGGPTLSGVTDFLADRKEAEELYMVVDEELKMMCRLCLPGTVSVTGPHLKEMARVAHTEYHIEGRTDRGVPELLRETMFAPTVTGSPVENAARVIQRHEPGGRRYYSGIIGLVGSDGAGRPTLDSAIVIRTAEIDPAGRLSLSVGSTLVRHSDPLGEVAETRAKASALLAAFGETEPRRGFAAHPEVLSSLRRRNEGIAGFWTTSDPVGHARSTALDGHKVLVVDAEDTFTSMLEHQLRALGLGVTVRRFDEPYETRDHDMVILGPGPGDPRDPGDPKVAALDAVIAELLAARRPMLAVCLSHQVLCRRLGLPVLRRARPNQGVQRRISLFGKSERVAFYNTYEARATADRRDTGAGVPVEICGDPDTGEIHALRGHRFASLQFHPESLLTVDGPRILTDMTEWVLGE